MFFSENFRFNNVYSKDMNVILTYSDNSVLTKYGTNYNSQLLSDGSDEVFYSETVTTEDIEFDLIRVDEYQNSIPWTLDSRRKVLDWMITGEFCEFISEDNPELIYYFKCIGVSREFNADMQGIMKLKMKPLSPYAFTPLIVETHRAKSDKLIEFDITNESNVTSKYYPQISILALEDNAYVEIFNTTTSEASLTLNGLKKGERVTIDCKMKSVFDDNGNNQLLKCNRAWLYLKKGKNNLQVKGNCEIEVMAQFPILV